MKRNWIRNVIRGLSLSSAMFIFQACYGTPQDFGNDILVEGQVKSKASGLPIEGIKVSVADNVQYEMTDDKGQFSFYAPSIEKLTIQFADVDAAENVLYLNTDTVLSNASEKVYLNIVLEEK